MRTILLLAYDISPYRGSEASTSWNYVINMMYTNRVVVIYGRGKNEIEDYLKVNAMPDVAFYNVALFSVDVSGFVKISRYVFNEKKWHKKAFELAKSIIEKEQIDIIHFISPSGFKEPGYLWKLNKPYVWGPMQGVHNIPYVLYKALSLRGKLDALIRRVVHNGMLHFMPRVRKAIKKTDYIFATSPVTHKQLRTIYHRDSYYLPANAFLSMETDSPVCYNTGNILNLIWVGTLCERKALIILLDALVKIKDQPFCLHVVGYGVLFQKLKAYSERKGFAEKIIWHGQVDRKQAQEILKNAHLHIVSSLGEGNPTTIWEAMSKGIPTMTLDHCGMSGVVCEKCGIKIPIKSYNQVVDDMAKHIQYIIEHPSAIQTLSEGVHECAKKYMWNGSVNIFNEVYGKLSK
jgi:glycosyltransferase involved in cell wall biosynthesis